MIRPDRRCRGSQIAGSEQHRQYRAGLLLFLTLSGAGLGLLSLLPRSPSLIWNATESVPVGLYRIEAGPPSKGDVIAIAPEGVMRDVIDDLHILRSGKLLLKTLAAASGDVVCRTGPNLSINGHTAAVARATTSDGRRLPVWEGCRVLAQNQILALAPHTRSLDSRYFGPIDVTHILGVARPVITLPQAGVP